VPTEETAGTPALKVCVNKTFTDPRALCDCNNALWKGSVLTVTEPKDTEAEKPVNGIGIITLNRIGVMLLNMPPDSM
tara:strand:+ start:1400 stop:1630 length:231 start_codon:yes stop_codon:yes gene_type:complete